MSRRTVIILVVLCALGILAGAGAWWLRPQVKTTPSEIQVLLHERAPIGSTVEHVLAFLDSARVEHGPYKPDERKIGAIWRRTSVSLFTESAVQVWFLFDEENGLARYEFETVVIGA